MQAFTSSSNADDSPLIYTEEGSLLTPEQQEEEDQVPPVSSYCSHVKIFCCVKFRYPLCVVIGNALALGLTRALLGGAVMKQMYSFRPNYNDKEELKKAQEIFNHQMKLVLTAGFAILTLIFVANSFLFWRSARRLELKVAERQQEETNQDLSLHEGGGEDDQGTERPSGRVPASAPDSPTGFGSDPQRQHKVDYVKLSKSVDTAFGCTSDAPTATFLVCLLYALFAMTTYKSVGTATKLLQVQFSNSSNIAMNSMCWLSGPLMHDYESEEKQEEYGIASLQKSDQYPDLPTEIQDWIKAHNTQDHMPPEFNRSLPYLETSDGTLVFDFKKKPPKEGDDDMMYRYRGKSPGLAIWNPSNDSVTEFMATTGEDFWGYDTSLELIGFPEEPPYTGWCGIFKLGSSFLQDEAVCYHVNDQNNQSELKRFPPLEDDEEQFGRSHSSSDDSMYATDDTLWVATRRDINRGDGYNPYGKRKDRKREILISLVAFNLSTMEKRVAAARNITKRQEDNYDRNHKTINPMCKKGYRWSLAASLLTLIGMSYYLYRLDVPSCVLPASLALTIATNAIFLKGPWAAVILLAMAGGCLYVLATKRGGGSSVLWKYTSLEMMIWALYSMILGACWRLVSRMNVEFIGDLFFSDEWKDFLLVPFFIFVAALAIAVLLDHPIFPIIAYGLGAVGAMSVLGLVGGIRFLIVPVVMFTLSLGCFRAGGIIQQYRVHLIVYCRRLGRCVLARCCCCCCGGRTSAVSRGPQPGLV